MGWASGSGVLTRVIDVIENNVKDDDTKYYIYVGLINVFQEYDCDTLDECLDISDAFDTAFNDVDNYSEIKVKDDEEDEEEEYD